MPKDAQATAIYDCGQRFFEKCLLADGSLIFDEPVWTLPNLEKFSNLFLDHPDTSDKPFLEKLHGQIGNAERPITRLGGEALALYYLFPTNITYEKKIKNINTILGWNGDRLPDQGLVQEALKFGLGKGSTAYFTLQYREIEFIIKFAITFKKLPQAEQLALRDPAKFKIFINKMAPRAFRNVILHILFPDLFENISSISIKRKIAEAFKDKTDGKTQDEDLQLRQIRQKLEAKNPGQALNFFKSPWLEMWNTKKEGKTDKFAQPEPEPAPMPDPPAKSAAYKVDDILADGCFLAKEKLAAILGRIRQKKNVILQGSPGTGKTWLAKRLAYALLGAKNEDNIISVQFHPAISYEDFVRGWRPRGSGLELCDGPFMQLVRRACQNPGQDYVLVIEEINRGNPAQIFGELLTLLEAGKRGEENSLRLFHNEDRIHVPENIYLIGTMNIADRSLAMVDFALRRRFAFIDLKPVFDEKWHDWMTNKDQAGLPPDFASAIARKLLQINDIIAEDSSLGENFAIGHSYVTTRQKVEDPVAWFHQIVETELKPLLREYWFDNPEQVKQMMAILEG